MFSGIFASAESNGVDELQMNTDRPTTRSQSSSLQPPRPLGLRAPSRSPSPVPHQGDAFTFPTTMATNDAAFRAAVEAATTAALAALQVSGSTSKKKPELPNFDPSNVEIWIKRVESAYIRSNISRPQDKFAFIEQKFSVDADPKVNDFLFGDSTEERWQEFLSYLKNRYGRSVKQQCTSFLRGFQRDGRRPTDMLAYVKDQTQKVTLDALYKEMIFSSLPADVQRAMTDKVEHLDAEKTAALADSFFDKDGKLLIPSTSINSVDAAREEEEEEQVEDSGDINAIGGRQRYQGRQNHGKKPFSRNSFRPSSSSAPSIASAPPPRKGGRSSLKNICHAHHKFGDKAYTCSEGCVNWKEFRQRQQQQQGNGKAGYRL